MKKQKVLGLLKVLTTAAVMTVSAGSISVFAEESTEAAPSGAPSGEKPEGNPPKMPSGGQENAPDGVPDGSGGGPGGGQSAVTSWDAETEFSSDAEEMDQAYDSRGTDENTIHVSGGNVVLNNPAITRNASDSSGGDNSSFYGVGAAVLTTDGTTYINGGSITTDGDGAAGAFSYGDGTTYIADTNISTTGNTAGGVHVAGGGTLYAYDVTVETQGDSSAAIRSDRGGGTMVVDEGSYTSNGTGSPAVYVTADISINDADLTANHSEALCLEGLNTVRLFDSNLTGNMQDLDQNDSTWTVILYQSMSGDSEEGKGSFYMKDGTITSKNGGLFYTTNTESDFYLENVDITTNYDDGEYFLRVSGNANQRGWGTTGSNGADTNFTAVNQVMNGDIYWDSISRLDFYITHGSSLTGAVIDDETYAGNGGDGYASIYIDDDSTWTVTGNSTVTNLYNAGTIQDSDGKTVSVKGSDGTVYVQGDSNYTITVEGTYSTDADTSGALKSADWEDYKVEEPEQLSAVSSGASASSAATAPAASASAESTVSAEADQNTSIGRGSLAATAGIVICAAAVIILIIAFAKKGK